MPAQKKSSPRQSKPSRIERRPALCVAILALSMALVFALLISVTIPQQFELQAGDIALQNITATKNVVDQMSTDARIEQARKNVEPVARRDDITAQSVVVAISGTFTLADEARETYIEYRERQLNLYRATNPDSAAPEIPPDTSLITRLKSELGDVANGLTDGDIRALITSSDASFAVLRDNTIKIVDDALEAGIKQEELSQSVSAMFDKLTSQVRAIDTSLRPFAQALLATLIQPNIYIDEDATEANRDAAEAEVEPVVYKKGQNIVRQGDPVQENELRVLETLGLIKGSEDADFPLYSGMGILLTLMGIALIFYMLLIEREILDSPRQALLLSTILLLTMGMSFGFQEITSYIIPVHFAAMALTVLVSPRVALCFNLFIGVSAGILASGEEGVFSSIMFEILLLSQVGGFITAYTLRRIPRRTTILLCGVWVAIASAATVFGVGLMTNIDMRQTGINAALAAVSALLSAIATIGFLPLFETVFRLMTNQKLLELSNPNQPLLRQLQIEAPGTYHHSLLVANLAEAAADAVGANALLARVGAYYHDIGKLKRPQFFKENQLDENNPHDHMQPEVSAAILAAHVRDGRQMGEKAKLPLPILDIIQQHHGTSSMSYFFYRAKKQAEENGEQINEDDFRYDGPVPNTKESAIISLSDTVEAAVRSLKEHTNEAMQSMISKLIQDKIQSRQMSDVDLTLKDFEKIEKAFRLVLGGIYHTRVEYPQIVAAPMREEERA